MQNGADQDERGFVGVKCRMSLKSAATETEHNLVHGRPDPGPAPYRSGNWGTGHAAHTSGTGPKQSNLKASPAGANVAYILNPCQNLNERRNPIPA